jgi:hypothetical protein
MGQRVVAAVILLLATPAAGDWLVLGDGTRIETDGPWSERGRLIVFTSTEGVLVSLRASEVDLEASRTATLEAAAAVERPAPPPPSPPPASVFRLTDADVGHVDDEAIETDEQEAPEPEAEAEEGSAGVVLTQWEEVGNTAEDGVAIVGSLENRGDGAAVGLRVVVTAYDVEGELLGTSNAQIGSSSLMPGETTRLIANFPGLFEISAISIETTQQTFALRPGEETED